MSTSHSLRDLTHRFSSATMFCLNLKQEEFIPTISLVKDEERYVVNVVTLCFPSKRKNVPKLSEQRLVVQGGMVPFPLYTCVRVKNGVSALKFSGEIVITLYYTTKYRIVESFDISPF